jgi:acetyltransferase-like isoleucine patch superfamily enzyme
MAQPGDTPSPPASPIRHRGYQRARWLAAWSTAAVGRGRRAWFVARLRVQAAWRRSDLDVDIAPDVEIGRGVVVTLAPRSRNRLAVGPRTRLGDRLLIEMDGAEVLIGDRVEVRRDCVFLVSGRLEIEGENLVSWGLTIHCADSIRIGRRTIMGERTTLVDSTHYHSDDERWVLDNVKTSPVVIGRQTWIGAKATIGRGVTVGDAAVIAANSLVITDVPDGHLALGVPAEVTPRRPAST